MDCLIIWVMWFVKFFLAKDATKAFEMQHHSDEARELMKSFYVGQYLDVRTMQTL